jgi:hypothetical protein
MTNYCDDDKVISVYFHGFSRFGLLEYENVAFEYLLSSVCLS